MMALQDRFRSFNSPRRGRTVLRVQRGFSLLELMITVSLALVVLGVSVISLQPGLQQSRINSAYDTTLMVLRNYRSQAITQRKRYIVTFTAPGTITVSYWGWGVPVAPAPVVVQTLTLPQNDTIQFAVQGGLPSTPTTVPDGFGNGTVAIDFGQGIGAGNLNYVMFMPDGTSQDTNNNLNSGILYFGRPGKLNTMRAITVVGATGRVRGWRLNVPTAGGPSWSQQ
jgi:prepilin-type N-terminal cleavage/methylation domain-containing protein